MVNNITNIFNFNQQYNDYLTNNNDSCNDMTTPIWLNDKMWQCTCMWYH